MRTGTQAYGNNNNFISGSQPNFNNHQQTNNFYNQKGPQLNNSQPLPNTQGNTAYFGPKNNFNNNKHQNNALPKEKIDYNGNNTKRVPPFLLINLFL